MSNPQRNCTPRATSPVLFKSDKNTNSQINDFDRDNLEKHVCEFSFRELQTSLDNRKIQSSEGYRKKPWFIAPKKFKWKNLKEETLVEVKLTGELEFDNCCLSAIKELPETNNKDFNDQLNDASKSI